MEYKPVTIEEFRALPYDEKLAQTKATAAELKRIEDEMDALNVKKTKEAQPLEAPQAKPLSPTDFTRAALEKQAILDASEPYRATMEEIEAMPMPSYVMWRELGSHQAPHEVSPPVPLVFTAPRNVGPDADTLENLTMEEFAQQAKKRYQPRPPGKS